MEKVNKAKFIQMLMEETNKDEKECILINDILENHNIIGHNNKEKIKQDFMEKLNIDETEADKLYNTCSGLIVKGIFRK